MLAQDLPKDIFELITEFTWGGKICYDNLKDQVLSLIDIRNSIESVFFKEVCFCTVQEKCVVSPYIDFHPFYPWKQLHPLGIWNPKMRYLHYHLSNNYFRRIRGYRMVFVKHLEILFVNGLSYWNYMFDRYFVHIRPSDLEGQFKLFALRFQHSTAILH